MKSWDRDWTLYTPAERCSSHFAKLTANGNHKPDSFFFPKALSNPSDLMRIFAFFNLWVCTSPRRTVICSNSWFGNNNCTQSHALHFLIAAPLRQTWTRSQTAASKICSGMTAIIVSDQLWYWMRAGVRPAAREWLFCRASEAWFRVASCDGWGGNGDAWNTASPARSQLLYNYSHTVWRSPNRAPSVCIRRRLSEDLPQSIP